ncbi:germinal-center associated nuclear protein-like [Oculina patagonica]
MTESGKDIIQGTCMQMCPAREIASREKQRRLHFFETAAFTCPSSNSGRQQDKLTADPRAAVKEFSRSAAGKSIDPSDLRPANVLLKTMNYLMEEIASKDSVYPWQMIYWFVFDRTRAIRQDLVIQRISGKPVVEIFEKACRFHILSGYKLCESPIDVFDPKINNDHISECLKRLLCFYDAEFPSAYRDTRAEFEAYYLLHNLGSFEALSRAVTLPEEIKNSQLFRLAFDIALTFMLKNFVRFFRLVKKLPYLACCAVHKHFNQVRGNAFAAVNTAYFSRNTSLPLMFLVEMSNFNDVQEACDFCLHFGLEVSDTSVKLIKGNLNDTQPPRARFSNMINMKLALNTIDILNGRCPVTKALVKKSVDASHSHASVPAVCSNNSGTGKSRLFSQPISTGQQSNVRQSWFGKGRGRGRKAV